ncbi:MAG: response regulator [Desulfatiglandales bacterium]
MKPFGHILMVDDDPDDYYLTRDALGEAGSEYILRLVSDGSEMLDYLLNRGNYADRQENPTPDLILLDLNMPRMDGHQALSEIRSCEHTKNVPVVIFTTSCNEEDINGCYRAGANSFLHKPSDYDSLVMAMRHLMDYWFNTVELPNGSRI